MRVVELEVGGERFELHPAVTVMRGLSPLRRAGVAAALSRLPTGDAAGSSCRVEVHGMVLDLEPTVPALLDLHAEFDAVIRPSDLPGPVGAATDVPARAVTEDRTLDEVSVRAREVWATAAERRWWNLLGADAAKVQSDLAARRRLVPVLERLLGDEPTAAGHAVEAARLADELVGLQVRAERLGPSDDIAPEAEAVVAARSRVAQCRDEVARDEERARLAPLTAEQVLALERAHARVRQAQERARHRLGGRAHRHLAHALAEETELLRRWSVPGWPQLGGVPGVVDDAGDADQDSRHRLSTAEEQQSAVERSIGRTIDDARRTIRHHATLAEARSLLAGTPDEDLPEALRQLARKGPTAGQLEQLRAELRSAGLELGADSVPDSETVELAVALLEECRQTAGDGGDRSADHQVPADGQVSAAERSAAAAVVAAAATSGAMPATTAGWGPSSAALGDLETVVLARLDTHRRVGLVGSVPVVLDDALGDRSPEEVERLLDALEAASLLVQVVVVTDDPAAAAWAERVGPERASVVTGGLG